MIEKVDINEKISDWNWRIKNLYHILNKESMMVCFNPNLPQRRLYSLIGDWNRFAIPKGRQQGISTSIVIWILDYSLFIENTQVGIIDQTLPDAQNKLEKIWFAYDSLDKNENAFLAQIGKQIKEQNPAIKTDDTIRFANGSKIEVGVSHRGGTKNIMFISELGITSYNAPKKAKEIISGAMNAVGMGDNCFIFNESTHYGGKTGEFYEFCRRAKESQNVTKTNLSIKYLFLPWHENPDYELDTEKLGLGDYNGELSEYFDELGKTYSVKLSIGQKWWYHYKYIEQGRDLMYQEFPSHEEEMYMGTVSGAYYKKSVTLARLENRVGKYPFLKDRPVYTLWDVGFNDPTVVVFVQEEDGAVRVPLCIGNSEWNAQDVVNELKVIRRERGIVYGEHFLPHDTGQRKGETGLPYTHHLQSCGLDEPITRVKVVPEVDIRIELTKNEFHKFYFDEIGCEELLKALEHYHREFIDNKGVFKPKPVHDWSSHYADAFGQFAWVKKLGKLPFALGNSDPTKPFQRGGRVIRAQKRKVLV